MSRYAWILVLSIAFSFILGACAASASAGLVDAPTLESPNITPPATLPYTPTTTWTATPIPTQRPSSTPEPSATPIPTTTSTPTPLACWEAGGRTVMDSLPTDQIRMPLDYRVHLPPCYDQQPDRYYPVLYLIHGQSFTDNQWDRLGADEVADQLAASGEISPFIIVMPRDRYGDQPTENMFANVIVEELIPHIDQNYRTLADRESRGVGGLSRGAGWAVHLGIAHWDLFGALGAHSLAVFHTDAQKMRTWLDSIPTDELPRIYLDIGDRDRSEIMVSAVWFEELLDAKDIPHEWYLFSGFHSETYWREHLEHYLRWYAKNW